jgi:hypothetical protein
MKAQTARALISLAGFVAAAAVFMAFKLSWLSVAACVVLVVGSGFLAEWAFRHLADIETKKRDLEDRLRNTLG